MCVGVCGGGGGEGAGECGCVWCSSSVHSEDSGMPKACALMLIECKVLAEPTEVPGPGSQDLQTCTCGIQFSPNLTTRGN